MITLQPVEALPAIPPIVLSAEIVPLTAHAAIVELVRDAPMIPPTVEQPGASIVRFVAEHSDILVSSDAPLAITPIVADASAVAVIVALLM